MPTPKHILVIRLSALGDIAMAVPLLYSLATKYPDVRFTVVSKQFARPFFEGLQNIQFLEADVYGRHRGPGLIRLANEAHNLNIDAVADLHNVIRSRILSAWLRLRGVPVATLDKGRRSKAALTRPNNKEFRPLKHSIIRYADVFEQLGLPVTPEEISALPRRDIGKRVQQLFAGPRVKAVGFAPYAAYKSKSYSLDNVREVVRKLQASGACQLFLFGGGESEADALSELARPFKNVVNIAGQLTLQDELALISNLDLMVAMDSANGHFAAMFAVPVITVWGVTHPYAGFRPFGQPDDRQLLPDLERFPQIPTSVYGNKYPDGYQDAINSISPSQVVDKVLSCLETGGH